MKTPTLLFCAGMLMSSLFAAEPVVANVPAQGIIPDKNMLHIGIVVRDIEAAMDHWAEFLGLDEKPNIIMANGHPDNPTQYRGEPSGAIAKLAFFDLENIQVELIEPLGDDESHWREFLEKRGEGVHHIGLRVTGIGEGHLDHFAEHGISVGQQGGWDGGEYSYMDTHDLLGVTVELLEMYNSE